MMIENIFLINKYIINNTPKLNFYVNILYSFHFGRVLNISLLDIVVRQPVKH